MQFFISDMHFSDKNIITYEHRPFNNLAQMNKSIIDNWNRVIKENDDIYILGDIGNLNCLLELKGNKYIVCGNHDDYNKIVDFKNLHNELNIIRVYDCPIMINNCLWLSHEPILYMPPEIPYLNIHGHIHSFTYGKGSEWNNGLRHFNVSVENINYIPITLDEISKIIKYS